MLLQLKGGKNWINDSGTLAAGWAVKRSPIPKKENKGNPWIDFPKLLWPAVFLVGAYADDDDGDHDGVVARHGGHTPNNRLTETCSLGLPCTFLIYDIMLWSTDTCQIKLSADQYHVTISRAQVNSSSRPRVLLKLTADQVLVFHWIEGSYQVISS